MTNLLELSGDHYTMGWQHGRQVEALRPQILAAMEQRLSHLALHRNNFQPRQEALYKLWMAEARPTLDMLRGIAVALSLDWEQYFRYTVAPYLMDRAVGSAVSEGCTVWAATNPVTHAGRPLMAKNRDYRPWHQAIQCLARAQPEHGYTYTYVTSAASPGVFSSGMNAAGLAVADTHVSSLDMAPGLARYTVMMTILELYDTVTGALDYLSQVPHLGDGTLTLADAGGDLAVFEAGHRAHGITRPVKGYVVSTNHYVTAQLHHRWLENTIPQLSGNTLARYDKVEQALQTSRGKVDRVWAHLLLGYHGNPLDSLCRHTHLDYHSATISSVIYLPVEGTLWFCDGRPCKKPFKNYSAIQQVYRP